MILASLPEWSKTLLRVLLKYQKILSKKKNENACAYSSAFSTQ